MTPSIPMAWLLAIPVVFDRKPHPLGVCSRDLVMVRAGSEQSAKMMYERRYGRATWGPSMIPVSGLAENRRFYPGRVVDLNGSEVCLLLPQV